MKIVALGDADAWAVGYHGPQFGPVQPLAEHWNGSAWSQVSVDPVPGQSRFSGVTMISNTDVWAVGITTRATMRPY